MMKKIVANMILTNYIVAKLFLALRVALYVSVIFTCDESVVGS